MIKATGVTKRFEDFTALYELSCTIPKGCIYGMVGSNGAGKSTFLRYTARRRVPSPSTGSRCMRIPR